MHEVFGNNFLRLNIHAYLFQISFIETIYSEVVLLYSFTRGRVDLACAANVNSTTLTQDWQDCIWLGFLKPFLLMRIYRLSNSSTF